MHAKTNMETYITIWKTDSHKQGLCINLEGWDEEGDGRRFKREGTYVYLWLIHIEV